MKTFAAELSERFFANENYWTLLESLRAAGVSRTLAKRLDIEPPSHDEVAKLLYCAEVFSQSEEEEKLKHAQEIAINTLLVARNGGERERALGLLTELGNFPSLKFAERHFESADESLLGIMNRRVSQQLNSVRVGHELLPLTDYQHRVWRQLPTLRTAAITAPTSAGKSFLVLEHLCLRALGADTFLAVYVTPTRALLAEVLDKMQRRLKDDPSIRVSPVPSFTEPWAPKQVFVLTQERLNVLLSYEHPRLKLDLVVVDEAQNIADDARGMILQDCLERIAQKSRATQVILLAPGAAGLPDVAKTFGISDLVPLSTGLSPVLQNRIVLSKVKYKSRELDVALMGRDGVRKRIGALRTQRPLTDEKTRLATVAYELSGDDSSLLYETGPREAEKTAANLTSIVMSEEGEPRDASLGELAGFIREHIHPDYQLAGMVQYGVGYHYGRMPALLREALEQCFKQEEGGLRFLVCTTTLAQGVNLPARNVFIDTPKRGRGKDLPAALMWNFAGRAGRLLHDVVGNVFLLNYERWHIKPMDQFVPFQVKPAISEALKEERYEIMAALQRGEMPELPPFGNDSISRIRAGTGLLIAHAARSDVHTFLSKVMPASSPQVVADLAHAAERAYEDLELPSYIIGQNWTVDPFGLKRLHAFILAKIEEDGIDELIPQNPHDAPQKHYETLFGFIVLQINGRFTHFHRLASRLAEKWMKGIPYPQILQMWIRSEKRAEAFRRTAAINSGKKEPQPKTVDQHIYQAFSLIEDTVRFEFVQLGKAYRDLLIYALTKTGNEGRVAEIFDFALALELGVSSVAGTVYIELGLSRIAATQLEKQPFAEQPRTVADARALLAAVNLESTQLSPIVKDELVRLGLSNPPSSLHSALPPDGLP